MKALFIGGTGTISMGIVKRLAEDPAWEVYLLNRGNRKNEVPASVKQITADIGNEEDVKKKLEGMTFDVVSDFIAFDVSAVERDLKSLKLYNSSIYADFKRHPPICFHFVFTFQTTSRVKNINKLHTVSSDLT